MQQGRRGSFQSWPDRNVGWVKMLERIFVANDPRPHPRIPGLSTVSARWCEEYLFVLLWLHSSGAVLRCAAWQDPFTSAQNWTCSTGCCRHSRIRAPAHILLAWYDDQGRERVVSRRSSNGCGPASPRRVRSRDPVDEASALFWLIAAYYRGPADAYHAPGGPVPLRSRRSW